LPAEIRNHIYEYVVGGHTLDTNERSQYDKETGKAVTTWSVRISFIGNLDDGRLQIPVDRSQVWLTPIWQVCRQLYTETILLPYTSNMIMPRFIKAMGKFRAHHIDFKYLLENARQMGVKARLRELEQLPKTISPELVPRAEKVNEPIIGSNIPARQRDKKVRKIRQYIKANGCLHATTHDWLRAMPNLRQILIGRILSRDNRKFEMSDARLLHAEKDAQKRITALLDGKIKNVNDVLKREKIIRKGKAVAHDEEEDQTADKKNPTVDKKDDAVNKKNATVSKKDADDDIEMNERKVTVRHFRYDVVNQPDSHTLAALAKLPRFTYTTVEASDVDDDKETEDGIVDTSPFLDFGDGE
jgi:hypothetical protein